MYQVGQQILDGQVTVITVDPNGMILSVEVPENRSQTGQPLVVTYNYGVTEAKVQSLI